MFSYCGLTKLKVYIILVGISSKDRGDKGIRNPEAGLE